MPSLNVETYFVPTQLCKTPNVPTVLWSGLRSFQGRLIRLYGLLFRRARIQHGCCSYVQFSRSAALGYRYRTDLLCADIYTPSLIGFRVRFEKFLFSDSTH